MEYLEDKIKQRLNRYQSEIDPVEIWEGIQRKRNIRKKRRILLLLPIATAFSLFFVLTLWINTLPDNKKEQQTNPGKEYKSLTHIQNEIANKEDKNFTRDERKTQDVSRKKNKRLKSTALSGIQQSKYGKYKNNNNNKRNLLIENAKEKDNIALKEKDTAKEEKKSLAYMITPALLESIRIKELKYGRTLYLATNPTPLRRQYQKQPLFGFSFELTPDYIYRDFVSKDDNAVNFMTNKKQSERYLEAFDASVLIGKNIYKGFGIYTGLNYSQYDTEMNFEYFKDIADIEDSVLTTVIVNSVTDTTMIYDRARVNKYYKITEKIYNYRRYFRIPVLLYFSGSIKRMDYELRTGLDFNIFSINKGRTVTPDGQTASLADTKSNLMKQSILGDLHFDLRLKYKLKNNWNLYFGPQYKLSSGNLMQKQAGFKMYYHSFGFNTGLSLKL